MATISVLTDEGATRQKVHAEFVLCQNRSIGHVWIPATKVGRRTQLGSTISYECARCTSWKHEVIGTWGQIVSRSYEYVDGYSYEQDYRPSGDALRLATLVVIREEQKQMSFDEEGFVVRRSKPKTRKATTNGNGRKPRAKKTEHVVDLAGEERREAAGNGRHLQAV